ncbi:MAG: acyl-CoA dehydrogenase family protein [Chloroflexota bacterium]
MTRPDLDALRADVRALCARFPDAYWRDLDERREHPAAFVQAMTQAGFLAALVPAEYGGGGMGVTEASVILEEVNRSGGHSAACHAQMYVMRALVRHASAEQKARWLPAIARGDLRLQAFSITEAEAGSDTTAIQTRAVRDAETGGWIIDGRKNWTSRLMTSDLALILARTTPREDLADRTRGLSLFLVDLREARESGEVAISPVRTMFNYETFEVEYRGLRVPADGLIGEEGMGFRYVIDGWNAERILLAAEAIGDGYWFIDRAVRYASERVVFGRPIGANQGVQFPLAKAYAHIVAADAVRWEAAGKFDAGLSCGAEANMAKLLASDASWEAANICLDTHGGNGFVASHDVERKFRETRLYQVAPVNNNLILAYLGQHVLGLPRSY